MKIAQFFSLLCVTLILGPCVLRADLEFIPEDDPDDDKPYANDVAYEVLFHYTLLGYAMYSDAFSEVAEFWKEVKAFNEAPSSDTFAAARAAWQRARLAYDRTEVFRFPRSPIEEDNLEALINAWQVQPEVLESELIGDTASFPELSRSVLVELSRKPEGPGVITGWHAVEFLLWGPVGTSFEDRLADFTEDKYAERRRAFLRAAMDLLVYHIGRVRGDWEEENYDNFAGAFLMERQDRVLGAVFTGIGDLSGKVMAEERLRAPFAQNDPAELLSRYSDTTTDDLLANLEGLRSIYSGTYQPRVAALVEGDGFAVLLASVDAELAPQLTTGLETAMEKVRAIPRPLGAILADGTAEERAAVETAATALSDLSALIDKAKVALGIDDEIF